MTTDSTSNSYLLPDSAYPEYMDHSARVSFDLSLSARKGEIPTEPGNYSDNMGDPWTLNEDGTWTDFTGETRTVEWNPVLALFGPWTKASS